MRLFLILLPWLSMLSVQAQTGLPQNTNPAFSKYVGKYGKEGLVVQVALNNGALVLVVPGAPLQEMIRLEPNKFKTNTSDDEVFSFSEEKGKITKMISQGSGGSLILEKISDTVDNFNGADSLLTLRKSTEHFNFLYSEIDSVGINHVASTLERDYRKILSDFKIKEIPVTIVRIYPTLKSFHQGINFPNAPDEVRGTAFGKSDFRMVSPNDPGSDSLMFVKGVTHEFTHCVHLNIAYSPNNPRWLWEGVAMFEADWFFDPKEIDVIKNKQSPPLASLSNGLEYMLGYAIIEAIKDIWGFDAVINLIKTRGDTQAVLKTSQKQFEEKIYEYIYKKYTQN